MASKFQAKIPKASSVILVDDISFHIGRYKADSDFVYRLNGKPGAGKSTLMKYISTKVPEFQRPGRVLSDCGAAADPMVCSFFFWSLGVPLQKNYVGFVRSLLYQIAEQRDDAISIMMGKNALSIEDGGAENAEESAPSYAWTIERLDDALRRFLDKKPDSLRFFIFLDGLDEFEGDEDPLLHTIRLLAQTPGTRVCVSSRPEEIFRQGFANSPQLKLQDFNYHDIEMASRERLQMTLAQYFPDSPQDTQDLIQDVVHKSSGIFLWADLMSKIIKRGSINGDTIRELRERLDRMPDTIDGLYQDMLSRLDKGYLRDASKYMHMLLIDKEPIHTEKLTLLHFACLEQSTQDQKMSDVATYYQSKEFDQLCRKLETRILARCGGLVEIIEQHFPADKAIQMFGVVERREGGGLDCKLARGSITRNIRLVRFIHKTAADFIRKYDIFVKDPKWTLEATLTVTRGRIEALALVPLMLDRTGLEDVDLQIDTYFLKCVMNALPLLEAKWPFEEDHQSIRDMAFDTINRIFDVADYVYTTLNVPNTTFSSQPNNIEHWNENRASTSFYSRLGCAAFCGCGDYVRRSVMPSTCSEGLAEEILDSALNGFYLTGRNLRGTYGVNPMFMELLKIISDFVHQSRSGFWNGSKSDEGSQPRWLTFAIESLASFLRHFRVLHQGFWEPRSDDRALHYSSQFFTTWKLVFKSILDHNVDTNYLSWVHWHCGRTLIQQEDVVITLRTSKTLLSSLKRELPSVDSVFTEDIVKLLETYGAVDRKDEVLIGAQNPSTYRTQLFRLTQVQREKLMQLPLERLFYTFFDNSDVLGRLVELPVVDQPSRRAEELLELLCQEAEQPGSEFRKETYWRF